MRNEIQEVKEDVKDSDLGQADEILLLE